MKEIKDIDFKEVLKKMNIKGYVELGTSLNDNLIKYKITNLDNALFFISNCCYESSDFTKLKESLFYTTPERLKLIFPSAFSSKFNANDYLRNTEKLANLVYNDNIFPNKKLGNKKPGDGFKYIGRGAIQVTGFNNYQEISKNTGVDFVNNPNLLSMPYYAILGSLAWWESNNCYNLKTLRETRAKVLGVSSGNAFNESLIKVQSIYNKLKLIVG